MANEFYTGMKGPEAIVKLNALWDLNGSGVGTFIYKGDWNASTNAYPTFPIKGFYYRVSVSGTTNSISYVVDDAIIYNGTTWDKIDNTTGGGGSSTNIAQGTRTTTTVVITSDTGTDATLSQASTSLAGIMSSADKTKLDGLSNYTLPTATAGVLGGVKVGTGLTIDGAGVLSATSGAGGTNVGIGTITTTTVPITSSTGTGTSIPAASTSLAGVMTSADKTKLDGLSNYTLPIAAAGVLGGVKVGTGLAIDGAGILSSTTTGVTNIGVGTATTTTVPITSSTGTGTNIPAATTSTAGIMTSADKTKLDGLSNYTHPANHSPSIIVQDASNRFVTDAEKNSWNAKQVAIGFTPENTSNKDSNNGYAGLTLLKLNLRNVTNTVTSWFTTAATVARTWTMPNKDGTVAMLDDITGTNSGTNTGDNATNSSSTPISHATDTANPHSVTKTQVGLGSVDNTSDAAKPVSAAQSTAIGLKQDTLVSGTNIKTINSTSLLGPGNISISGSSAPVYLYDNRNDIRALNPTAYDVVIVEGLGFFVWYSSNLESDDDETCFATTLGRWILVGTDPEFVYATYSILSNTLEGRTTTLEGRTTTLEGRTTTLEGRATAVEGRATAVEGRATSLESKYLSTSFSMSLTTLASVTSSDFTVTVTGAVVGDRVVVTPGDSFGTSTAYKAMLSYVAYVSAANTVIVSIRNASSASASMTASTWQVLVIKL